MSRLSAAYVPRRPHETVLYRLVKENGDDFLRHARETYDGRLPRYVEDELRGYLRCGDFSRGFVHATCETCGHDLLVAFSCKNRGLCPSCAGRRMAAQAAHLVDCILPAVPLRQYVLSFPFELSALAATKPDVLTALARIHAEALAHHYRAWAKGAGHAKSHPGAVTFVQRFGSSLNLHVHMHTVSLDGVFVQEGPSLRFAAAPAPTRGELTALVVRIVLRVMRWLKKRGYLHGETESNDAPQLTFEETLAQAALSRGTMTTLREDGAEAEDSRESARTVTLEAVVHQGFNLHAGVTIAEDDDMGRERLCRYGLRPPFSLARFRLLPDGRIAYRVKKVGHGKSKHRVMTPVECIARLCALVPPPRYPLTRFHGVLAPRHTLRRRVIPRPPSQVEKKKEKCATREWTAPVTPAASPATRAMTRTEPVVPKTPVASAALLAALSGVDSPAPNVLSLAHWARLRGGLLFAASCRIEWALLLQRTFECDVRQCGRCGGRLSVRAVVTEPASAANFLAGLARSRDPPRAA